VEKVRVDTTPHDSADVLAARSDAVADLQALLAQADTDPAFMQSLQEGLMQMVGKLPLEVIGALPVLEDIRAGRLQPLVQATAPSLLAHLAKAD
jgi:exonuclease SbcD